MHTVISEPSHKTISNEKGDKYNEPTTYYTIRSCTLNLLLIKNIVHHVIVYGIINTV